MAVTNISLLRKNLYSSIDNVIEYNDSITVSTKNGNAVIISEAEYNSMLETIYPVSQKGLAEKIKESEKEDIKPGILTIKQIRERVKTVIAQHEIKEVYLFGSYSRGEANRNSDVDLYCDKGDVDTLWKLSAFVDELEEALGKKVDIVLIGSHMDDYFKEELEKDMLRIC